VVSKSLLKPSVYSTAPPPCPQPTISLGQKAPFPSSNVILLFYRHSKYCTPATVANETANQTTQWQLARIEEPDTVTSDECALKTSSRWQ